MFITIVLIYLKYTFVVDIPNTYMSLYILLFFYNSSIITIFIIVTQQF